MSKIFGMAFKWSRIRNQVFSFFGYDKYEEKEYRELTKLKNHKYISRNILEVGDKTYGEILIQDEGNCKVIIDNYCSIANGTKFVLGFHRTDLITTYPFKALNRWYSENLVVEDDHIYRGNIVIGNDVWIGLNVIIMSGVKIGDGAIIGANSVVTKDVEPYSIVLGSPAKHIRYRIERAELRSKLQEIAWWNWSESEISEKINEIMSSDIEGFIKKYAK